MVGVWDCEVGQGACWAARCEHGHYYLDGDAVGGVYQVGGWEVGRDGGGREVRPGINVCTKEKRKRKIIQPCTLER